MCKISMNPEAAAACSDRDIVVLDFYNTADYLKDKTIGNKSITDLMMDMFPDWCSHGNDSYWHLYREWIKTEAGQQTWDTICEVLGIDQNLPKRPSGYQPDLCIVFWVSW